MAASSPKRRVGGHTVAALALMIMGTACTGGVTRPGPVEGTTDVTMDNNRFSPQHVTIDRGERVRWFNAEGGIVPVPHTSTSGDPADDNEGDLWDSGTLSPGETFTQQFDEVGTFEYFCTFHFQMGQMRGATVTVVEPQPQP